MSKKKNIFIIPRAGKIGNIRNHSMVCSFFLSKYLKKYYNIINGSEYIEDHSLKDSSEIRSKAIESNISISLSDLLKEDYKVDYILTTNQRGFTKFKKINKKQDLFKRIKNKNKNIKFMSIHDHSALAKYVEDVLLIALPFDDKKRVAMRKASDTKLVYTGWCADHAVFNDSKKKNGNLNIVLDHAALQGFRADATKLYVNQIKKLKKKYPKKKINLCRLKKGFEFYDFKKNAWTRDLSLRWWKSKYDNDWENGKGCTVFQIAECLNSSHIFCVTHVESCGLTGIEALMAGCKVYIPEGEDTFRIWGTSKNGYYKGPFLKKVLLKPYMDYNIFNILKPQHCFKLFERDINNYKLKYNRKILVKNNSWQAAAKRAFNGLENK